jgi:hypothetical protein
MPIITQLMPTVNAYLWAFHLTDLIKNQKIDR